MAGKKPDFFQRTTSSNLQFFDHLPKGFKAIVVEEENLFQRNFKKNLVHRSNLNNLRRTLEQNRSSNVSLVCSANNLNDVALLLPDNLNNLKTVYVRAKSMEDIFWPYELENANVQCIRLSNDEEELMRYLYLEAMLCYFHQGKEYQNQGNYGLANQCFLDAREMLKQIELLH